MSRFFKSAGTITLVLLISAAAVALSSPFKNIASVARSIGLAGYDEAKSVRTIKIAILDNGFKGYAKEIGVGLPSNTVYHPGPVKVDPAGEETHGLYMAQILAGLLRYSSGVSYELHLYSAFGYSNLESAVNDIVANRFDVVLYSQVWEYGGNGDGRGFINTLINKALATGVVWVNASGNFGSGTYQSAIELNDDNWVKLPAANDTVRIRCEKSVNGFCPLRVVLSWNDFSDDVDTGTDKDLDLILADDTLKIVASSALQQMKNIPEGAVGASLYPREIVTKRVNPGQYLVRVKARSQNFDKNRDRLRITISGDNITVLNTTPGETLLPPADNPGVITVGATDTDKTASSASMSKPELQTASLITLNNGDQYKGSSNAAAITAAAATIIKGLRPQTTRDGLLKMLSGDVVYLPGGEGQGLPLSALQFEPTGPSCFRKASLPTSSAGLRDFLKKAPGGATVVETTKGIKIFTALDPFQITGEYRVSGDDMLVVSSRGFEPLPRTNQDYLPEGTYEIVQIPKNQFVCPPDSNPSGGATGKRMRLPRFNEI